MNSPHNIRTSQDILFVCGCDREVNSKVIISDIELRPVSRTGKTVTFIENDRLRLALAPKIVITGFTIRQNLDSSYIVGSEMRDANIAIIEHLPGILSEFVATTWRADCDVVCEIITGSIEDAFRQVRIHFLKHHFGETAQRAKSVRVFFEGNDVTEKFRDHEEKTRLKYPSMNKKVTNPSTRDNCRM